MYCYKSYCKGLKERKLPNIYDTEQAFNRAYGITEVDTMPPLFISPKLANSKSVKPTLHAHIKVVG